MQRILFFDGECNLCNGFVDFMLRHQTKVEIKFAPLQGVTAKRLIPDAGKSMASVIYLKDGQAYQNSTAVLSALTDLGGLWTVVCVLKLIPPFLRDALYRFIARRRYLWFGRRSCRVPTPAEKVHFLD